MHDNNPDRFLRARLITFNADSQPERSVVIPGVRQKTFPAGEYGVPCALIIGRRSAQTDKKVSLNDALRDFGVPV